MRDIESWREELGRFLPRLDNVIRGEHRYDPNAVDSILDEMSGRLRRWNHELEENWFLVFLRVKDVGPGMVFTTHDLRSVSKS